MVYWTQIDELTDKEETAMQTFELKIDENQRQLLEEAMVVIAFDTEQDDAESLARMMGELEGGTFNDLTA